MRWLDCLKNDLKTLLLMMYLHMFLKISPISESFITIFTFVRQHSSWVRVISFSINNPHLHVVSIIFVSSIYLISKYIRKPEKEDYNEICCPMARMELNYHFKLAYKD